MGTRHPPQHPATKHTHPHSCTARSSVMVKWRGADWIREHKHVFVGADIDWVREHKHVCVGADWVREHKHVCVGQIGYVNTNTCLWGQI